MFKLSKKYARTPLGIVLTMILAFPMCLSLWHNNTLGPSRIGLFSSWIDMIPIEESLIRVPLHYTTSVTPPEWHDQPAFFASRREITTDMFCDYINDTERGRKVYNPLLIFGRGQWKPKPQYFGHPMTGITHAEAEQFCEWLSEKTGWRFQVPNTFHWRAMTQANRPGLRYPWGWQPPPESVVYNQKGPSPSTRKTPSTPLRQILGNVYEWGEGVSPTHALIRGGAWSDKQGAMLDANLEFEQPRGFRSPDIGFRIVGTPPSTL